MKFPLAGAKQWRRSLLGIGSISIMALVLALAAALGPVAPGVAAAGCLAFAALAAITYGAMRSGASERIPDADLAAMQLAAAFLVLAWLTYRSLDSAPVIPVLYLVAMLYGMLQLDRARLAALATIAAVTHGTALFMVIDDGHRLDQAAVWTQFGALVLAFAWFTFAAGIVLRLRSRLAEAHRRLHELGLEADERASRDALTGVYHHRHLVEALEREISRAERIGKPLSIARVDLDFLGSVNQTHGPGTGDIALKRFAKAAAGALRDVDVFGRYGGKEFLVLMPDTGVQGAIVAAERIRAAVRREPLPEVHGRRHLGCTLGVAEHRKGENARLVIARAEAGLNYAKAAGRNRVVALDADGRPVAAEAH